MMPPTVDQKTKKKSPAGGLRRLLSLSPRRMETAFLPDTSLVLEERRQQLRRHDWKSLPPSGRKRVSFSPRSDTESDIGSEIYDTVSKSADSSKDGSEIYGIVKGRQMLPVKKKEEWNADGKQRPNSTTPDQSGRGSGGGSGEEEGSGGRGGSRRLRDDLRRHTLSSSEHRYAQLRSVDLESPQPRGYPPPNMLLDDDPGIMSEVETSSTGFRRGNRQRSSLPVVRTTSKTLERPLGLVFLQYRSETKRALLPNEITSIDTVKALFVRSFPKQLTMEYMDSPHVKIYIHDSSKDMFYELEDLRSHLRDIRDRSVLRLFESGDVIGAGPIPTWDQDQSYFSEPEFDSEFQHQHIHKTKGSKSAVGSGPPYYMTHSFPPGGTLPRTGGPLLRPYPPPAKPPTQVDGYMSSPERGPRGYGTGPGYPGYDDPYYTPYSPRPGTITPVIDEEARLRVEHMERQLASLTGLVQKALTQAVVPGPPVPQTPSLYHRSASDKSVSFEKSVSFSDEPPDMNSPKQHSPQHPDRDRHKPTPPPKPVSLSPGQYESRNVYRDLQLTAEMYNHLRGLQKKAKDLRQEVRALRRMSQAQAHSVRETIRDTFLKIRAVLMSAGGEGLWCPNGDEARMRVNREGDLYRQQMLRLESDLTELEGTVEELRGNVINRKTRVNMSDVESMALVLSKSSKTVAELKLRFPSLQDAIKGVIAQEMEKVVTEEKFLKDEPERLESALRRCKKLTGTLVTLKRLASVQEQRLPESRLSPSLDETPPVTPTSGKCVKVGGEENGV